MCLWALKYDGTPWPNTLPPLESVETRALVGAAWRRCTRWDLMLQVARRYVDSEALREMLWDFGVHPRVPPWPRNLEYDTQNSTYRAAREKAGDGFDCQIADRIRTFLPEWPDAELLAPRE